MRFIDLFSKIIVITKAQDEFDFIEQSMCVEEEIVTRILWKRYVDSCKAYTHVSREVSMHNAHTLDFTLHFVIDSN